MQVLGFEIELERASGTPSGSPLVLLHGFTGSAASWHEVSGLLPKSRSIVRVNLPGHHPLSPVDPQLDFDGAVDALARALRAMEPMLGVNRGALHIAGYSLGGRMALGLIVRHRELFARATLIGAGAGLELETQRKKREDADREWIEILRREGTRAFVAAWERQPILRARASVPRESLEARRAIRLAHDASQLANALEQLGLAKMPSFWWELRRIGVKVRVVAGAEDTKYLAIAARMSARIPNSELAIVPDSGHNVPLDQPQLTARLLEA